MIGTDAMPMIKQQNNTGEQLGVMSKSIEELRQAVEGLASELAMVTVPSPPVDDRSRTEVKSPRQQMCNVALEIASKNTELVEITARIHAIRRTLDI